MPRKCCACACSLVACSGSRPANKLDFEGLVGVGCWPEGGVMKEQLKLAGLAVRLGVAAGQAAAQEKVKIGVIVTLSGPPAALGAQARDGFALGINDLGGRMAGKDGEVGVANDELKPDGPGTQAKGLLRRDNVD